MLPFDYITGAVANPLPQLDLPRVEFCSVSQEAHAIRESDGLQDIRAKQETTELDRGEKLFAPPVRLMPTAQCSTFAPSSKSSAASAAMLCDSPSQPRFTVQLWEI